MSLDEALSLPHRHACRVVRWPGDTMYKSILGTDLPLIFVVTFVAVLALVGVIARDRERGPGSPADLS